MEFKNPYFFALLALLIPYIIWYVLRYKKSLPALRMPEIAKYRFVPRSWRIYLLPVPFFLRVFTMILVICILARPQSKHTWSNTDVEGIDIMLSVDVSTSMLTEDFKPNRVEALKEIAQKFVDKRPNDNIGLTFFAGEAYTQCPLTTDHVALMNLYNSADTLVLAHNHPFGSAEPSDEDILLTRQVQGMLDKDIRLIDHVIVGADSVVSMRGRGFFRAFE